VKSPGVESLEIIEYDPSWPTSFETLRARILGALGTMADSIEHVGSSAVPGMAAKPIIDLTVVVLSASDVPQAIERLATLGYKHRGELGIEGREAFDQPSGPVAHHLYLCVRGGIALANHLTVRDYLRHNPEAVVKYSMLKRRLAKQFPHDREQYGAAKSDFLLSVLRAGGLPEPALAAIAEANRLKF
jgi:GrpB-like predicted nucleotidyltransferase (UPF0157 family)